MKNKKLGEKEQGCEWMCRFRSEKDINKSEEIEKANMKGTEWERGRLHGNEVLIRVSIMLDNKNYPKDLELYSKINGKPLNSFHDMIRFAFSKENGLERESNRYRKMLQKGEGNFENLQMVSAIF